MGTIKPVTAGSHTVGRAFRNMFMRMGRIIFHPRPIQLNGYRPGRILLVKTHAVGDVLLTTPAIRAVRRRFPGAELHLLVCDQVRNVVDTNPDIDKIISFDSRLIVQGVLSDWMRLIRRLRAGKYDLAVIFHPSPWLHLICWAAGIARRVGFDQGGSGFSLSRAVPWQPNTTRYVADVYLDLARTFDPAPLTPLVLELTPDDRRKTQAVCSRCGLSANEVLVAVCPGGGLNPRDCVPEKQWPPERFAAVIDRLGCKVALVGGKSDKDAAAAVDRDSSREIINLCGELTFRQTAALFDRCALVISNDSAPLHIAVAMGTPTVGIYGPSNSAALMPSGNPRHIAVTSSAPCSPCYANSVFPGCQRPKCLENVSVDEVLQAASAQLSNCQGNREEETAP